MYTANNIVIRGSFLLLFFLLFSVFITSHLSGQKISKYYTVSAQKSGNLYFIEPEYSFENKKEKCELVYDMTYLSTDDSLMLNFSFISPEILEIDSISFIFDQKNIGSKTQKLFIEDKKKVWEHRYSSKFLFEDINEVFHSKSPKLAVSSDGMMFLLNMKQKKWKKETDIVMRILKLIQVNKL